jgi:hypothetical protein
LFCSFVLLIFPAEKIDWFCEMGCRSKAGPAR